MVLLPSSSIMQENNKDHVKELMSGRRNKYIEFSSPADSTAGLPLFPSVTHSRWIGKRSRHVRGRYTVDGRYVARGIRAVAATGGLEPWTDLHPSSRPGDLVALHFTFDYIWFHLPIPYSIPSLVYVWLGSLGSKAPASHHRRQPATHRLARRLAKI